MTIIEKILQKIEEVKSIAQAAAAKAVRLEQRADAVEYQNYGTATISDVYSYSGGTANISWYRIGKVVIVNLYDIIMRPAVTTSDSCVFASDLPKAKYNSSAIIASTTTTEPAKRVWIPAGSTGIAWFWNSQQTENTAPMTGQLIYIAE